LSIGGATPPGWLKSLRGKVLGGDDDAAEEDDEDKAKQKQQALILEAKLRDIDIARFKMLYSRLEVEEQILRRTVKDRQSTPQKVGLTTIKSSFLNLKPYAPSPKPYTLSPKP
jgi:hypothetical protein